MGVKLHVRTAYVECSVFGGPITYHCTVSSGYAGEETYTEYEDRYEVINGESCHHKELVTKTKIVKETLSWRR